MTRDFETRKWQALRSETPPEILLQLAQNDPDLGVWWLAANNSHAPPTSSEILQVRVEDALKRDAILFNEVIITPVEAFSLVKIEKCCFLTDHQEMFGEPGFRSLGNHIISLTLDLHKCEGLPESFFEGLKYLKHFQLNYYRHPNLPQTLGTLSTLTTLGIRKCFIQSLPATIGQLGALKRLEVVESRLEQIPVLPSSMMNLTQIWVPNNKITQFPAFLHVLPKLQELNLMGNEIHQIAIKDKVTFALLRQFSLAKNELESLSLAMIAMPQLTELILSHNCLKEIPPEISDYYGLKRLDLDHNQLDSLPDSISALIDLEKLDLSCNKLQSVPPAIWRCSNLIELDLSDNPISEIPPEIMHLKRLKILLLGGTSIKKLPEFLLQLPLRMLDPPQLSLLDPQLLNLIEHFTIQRCEFYSTGTVTPFNAWNLGHRMFSEKKWVEATACYWKIVLDQLRYWEFAVTALMEIHIFQTQFAEAIQLGLRFKEESQDPLATYIIHLFLAVDYLLLGKRGEFQQILEEMKKIHLERISKEEAYDFASINEFLIERLSHEDFLIIVDLEQYIYTSDKTIEKLNSSR